MKHTYASAMCVNQVINMRKQDDPPAASKKVCKSGRPHQDPRLYKPTQLRTYLCLTELLDTTRLKATPPTQLVVHFFNVLWKRLHTKVYRLCARMISLNWKFNNWSLDYRICEWMCVSVWELIQWRITLKCSHKLREMTSNISWYICEGFPHISGLVLFISNWTLKCALWFLALGY